MRAHRISSDSSSERERARVKAKPRSSLHWDLCLRNKRGHVREGKQLLSFGVSLMVFDLFNFTTSSRNSLKAR